MVNIPLFTGFQASQIAGAGFQDFATIHSSIDDTLYESRWTKVVKMDTSPLGAIVTWGGHEDEEKGADD